MSGQFKVGEVVVGCNHVIDVGFNGLEAVITGPLEQHDWQHPDGSFGTDLCYALTWANGLEELATPNHLRRRKPPTTGEQSIMALFLVTPQPSKVAAKATGEHP